MKLEFPGQILVKSLNIKLHQNPSSRSRIVLCVLTDGHDEENSRFSQFCERAYKRMQVLDSDSPSQYMTS
jgi:hypothetical protein